MDMKNPSPYLLFREIVKGLANSVMLKKDSVTLV